MEVEHNEKDEVFGDQTHFGRDPSSTSMFGSGGTGGSSIDNSHRIIRICFIFLLLPLRLDCPFTGLCTHRLDSVKFKNFQLGVITGPSGSGVSCESF